jgi:hypothetical protein
MNHKVKFFKNLTLALQQLAPYIVNGQHIQTGKPFKNFADGRPRELIANWLICAALNSESPSELWKFSSDPTGSDGILYDITAEIGYPMEHVLVPMLPTDSAADSLEDAILEKIEHKRSKGAAYASGKALAVFLFRPGAHWFPNKVAKRLPEPMHFAMVWVVGPQSAEDGQYSYNVSLLKMSFGDAPTWRVHIAKAFDAWTVDRLQ